MLEQPYQQRESGARQDLCDEALRLAEQLAGVLHGGNPAKEILDRLAFLLQELTGGDPSGAGVELSEPMRATLAKVQSRIVEAERTASGWMSAAGLDLDRLARSRVMQKAYGSRRP